MKVNKFDLLIVKYITQNEISSFSSLEQYFEKDKTTIYRSLQRSFSYISKYKSLSQPTVPHLFDINYSDYICLINTLDLASYKPDQEERVECVISMLIFNKVISKQEIYKIIGVSVSTLKNDTQILNQALASANLSLVTHRRKGTELTGNELGIRLLVTMQLMKLSQLDQELGLYSKMTNNPIGKILFDVFYNKCKEYLTVSKEQLIRVCSDKKVSLDYNSRKFMMIYLIVSNFRASQGYEIERKNIPKLPWHDSVLLEEKSDNENRVLSSIFYSLAFKKGQYLCYDSRLLKAVREFLTSIQREFITDIKDSLALESDIYLLMKNIISRKKLGFNISENKLNYIYKTEHLTYKNVANSICLIENEYGINFSNMDIASLTLVVKKHTERNKSIDRDKKRICFISNSSENDIGFFIERFKSLFHVEVIDIIDINELHSIDKHSVELLICFTKKIQTIAKKNGYTLERIDFSASKTELWQFGQKLLLSRASRKIPIDVFLSKLKGRSDDEIKYLLSNEYQDYFI